MARRKKFNYEDLEDTLGPMNDVAKLDALVYANAPKVKHLSKLEPRVEREVRAKKQKIKKSSKKAQRSTSKQIIKNLPDNQ